MNLQEISACNSF